MFDHQKSIGKKFPVYFFNLITYFKLKFLQVLKNPIHNFSMIFALKFFKLQKVLREHISFKEYVK